MKSELVLLTYEQSAHLLFFFGQALNRSAGQRGPTHDASRSPARPPCQFQTGGVSNLSLLNNIFISEEDTHNKKTKERGLLLRRLDLEGADHEEHHVAAAVSATWGSHAVVVVAPREKKKPNSRCCNSDWPDGWTNHILSPPTPTQTLSAGSSAEG